MTIIAPPPAPAPSNPLLEHTIPLRFGSDTLHIGEMTIRQTMQLADMQGELAGIDLNQLLSVTPDQRTVVLKALCIMLAVPQDRLLSAKQSELISAVQACVAVNKSFFLQMVDWWVQAVALKVAVQNKLHSTLQTLQQTPPPPPNTQPNTLPNSSNNGHSASAPSSPQATPSAASINTATANTLPTSRPSTTASATS